MRKKVKGRKTSFKQIKIRKLVQAGSSWSISIFLLIYFRFSTIIITFATKYHLSIP